MTPGTIRPTNIKGFTVPAWIVAALHNERGVELAIETIKATLSEARFPIYEEVVLTCLEEAATARMNQDMELFFHCQALKALQ